MTKNDVPVEPGAESMEHSGDEQSDGTVPVEAPMLSVWAKVAAVFVVAGAIVVFVWGPRDMAHTLLEVWQTETGPVGALGYAAFYVVATCCFAPSSLLGVGAGFLFGGVWGTIIAIVCRPLGGLVAFWIGRHLARRQVKHWIEGWPRFQAIDRLTHEDPFQIVLLLRLVPVLTFNITNYVFGVTAVRWQDYLKATFLGVLPGTVFYVYIGVITSDITEALAMDKAPSLGDNWILWGIAGAVFAALGGYIVYRARQKWHELLRHEEEIRAETEASEAASSEAAE